MVIGESILAESGTLNTNKSSSSWSYGIKSTTSVFWGNISLTRYTLLLSSMSSGIGSYNLSKVPYV